MPAILDAKNLCKVYRRGQSEVAALRAVDLEVEPGSWLAVMGPSGSGKTTLLNLLAGLDQPSQGAVWIAGTCLSDQDAETATVFRRRNIGFVFQFFNLLPSMSAQDNVALPLLAERLALHDIRRRAAQALAAVGLAARADHRPDELSGGEQQRVAIARALVMQPRLLLADEPTGSLDSQNGGEILALLRSLVEDDGVAIVMVTHSASAARAADRILYMRDGALATEAGEGLASGRATHAAGDLGLTVRRRIR